MRRRVITSRAAPASMIAMATMRRKNPFAPVRGSVVAAAATVVVVVAAATVTPVGAVVPSVTGGAEPVADNAVKTNVPVGEHVFVSTTVPRFKGGPIVILATIFSDFSVKVTVSVAFFGCQIVLGRADVPTSGWALPPITETFDTAFTV